MRRRAVATGLALALAPAAALAHAPLPGVEGFWLGLQHALAGPAGMVALPALALMAGRLGFPRLWIAGGAFGAALLAGLLLGVPGADPAPAILATALVAAGLAALLPGRLASLALVVATAAGLLTGAAAAPGSGPLPDRVATGAGAFLAAGGLMVYGAALVAVACDRIGRPWFPLGLRILAAWVAAVAALMLALTLVPPPAG